MRTEIFLEGRRLDLTAELSSEFTYQIDDIKDFAARNTNFSKTIVLPSSARNNKAFGFIFEFGSGNAYDDTEDNYGYNFNASKAAQAIIYIDKIQIFKGALRLLEIVRDGENVEYECAIFGELGGLITSFGVKKLTDLDFSAYDHEWNLTNISASWEYASGNLMPASGYYYPLIDYGNVSYNLKFDWDVKAFRPAFYVREYIDKIITGAGYTWEGDFLNTAFFKRLIIPNNQKELYKIAPQGIDAERYSQIVILDPSTSSAAVTYNTVQTGNFTHSSGVFTYTGAGETLAVAISVNGLIYDNDENPVNVYIRQNSTDLATYTYPAGGIGSRDTISIAWAQNVTFATNDTIQIFFESTGFHNADYLVRVDSADLIVSSGASNLAVANYGDEIIMNQTIPKGIFQRDFFASIVKMFNLYVVEDKNKEKHIKIIPFIDFYDFGQDVLLDVDDIGTVFYVNNQDALLLENGTTDYLDWTYKLDRSRPVRLKPMSEINARYFEFRYKQDNDYYNEQYFKKFDETYGSRIEDTGWEFGNDKQTAEVIFAPTPLVQYQTSPFIVPAIYKLSNTNSATATEDRTEHVIRIMQVKKVSPASFAIKNGSATTLATVTSYGYAGHLDDPYNPQIDLNFGAPQEVYFTLDVPYPSTNIYNTQWSEYVAEITDKDSKLMIAYFRLDEMDIYNLDFSKLVHIDGTLWRLNKVIDYNPVNTEVVQCELLRVIETTY
jgi:hypothetical protein